MSWPAIFLPIPSTSITDLSRLDSLPGVTGLTPLHLAAFNGSYDAVTALLDAGADIDAEASDGSTPLMLAVRRNEGAVADLLRHKRADDQLQ